jgi:hypothetical protein
MSEKLYNGLEPKNSNLVKAEWGGRVHCRRQEPLTAAIHKRLLEKFKDAK